MGFMIIYALPTHFNMFLWQVTSPKQGGIEFIAIVSKGTEIAAIVHATGLLKILVV